MKPLKELINEDRYKIIGGYKFDKIIFNLFFVLFVAFLFNFAYKNDFDLDYFECGMYPDGTIEGNSIMLQDFSNPYLNVKNGNCRNPFYKPASWKNEEYLTPGVYGLKPVWFIKQPYYFVFGLLFIVLLINHVIHNRRFISYADNN